MTPTEFVIETFDAALGVDVRNTNQTLAELGLDSLDQVELLMAFEDEIGDVVDDGFLFTNSTTVRDIINLVKEAQANDNDSVN